MNKIYFGDCERFGYTLQCIGTSENEVKAALIKEYIKAYKHENGVDPRNDGTDCYEVFLSEMFIEEREIGKVYWA